MRKTQIKQVEEFMVLLEQAHFSSAASATQYLASLRERIPMVVFLEILYFKYF